MIGNLIVDIGTEGDREFIVGIYEKYKTIMFVTAKRYMKENDAVEDIVQESLVKLISNISTLKRIENSKIEAYIAVTVKNTAVSFCRKKKYECQYITFDEIEKDNCGRTRADREVEKTVEATEEMEVFHRCLKKLSDRDQDILCRKYYMMQSDEQIAKLHEVSSGSVRMILTRIRRRVLNEMKKEGVVSEVV